MVLTIAKSIEERDLDFIKFHARKIMVASPVLYVRDAVLRGTLFHEGDTSGLVSGADTAFFVDHKVPREALEHAWRRGYWPLGDLPAGHEFLLL